MRPFGEGSGGALRLFAAVAAAYAATAFLSWQFFEVGLNPKFYVPAGITLAAMLLTPRRRWPLIVAAIAVAEISVDMYFGTSLPVAIGFVAANSLEPIVGASLVLAWCGGSPDLRRRADLAKFVVAGCTAGPLVGGLIGGSLSAIGSGHPWWSDVIQWWVGDGIGALVIASPILLWAKQSHVIRSRPIETALVLVATVAVSVTAFWAETPPTLLLLPLMAWAAFRLDVLGAALAGSTLALAANYMTLTGHGPFAEYSSEPVLRQAATQIFIAVIVLVAMLTAQEVAGRLAAVRAHESERRERLRLENLSRLAQQLSAALTPRDIGRALEEQVLNEAGASALGLGLVNADLNRLEWVITPGYSSEVIAEVQGGLPLSDSNVTTDAVRSGRPVIIADAAEYALRYPANLRWLEISGAESIVGWPLTSGGESIGTLLLAWSEPQKLDAAQLAFISAVATMVGQALVRARVYADEHARAAVMQSALVPSCPTAVSGIEVCVSYQPADVAHGLGGGLVRRHGLTGRVCLSRGRRRRRARPARGGGHGPTAQRGKGTGAPGAGPGGPADRAEQLHQRRQSGQVRHHGRGVLQSRFPVAVLRVRRSSPGGAAAGPNRRGDAALRRVRSGSGSGAGGTLRRGSGRSGTRRPRGDVHRRPRRAPRHRHRDRDRRCGAVGARLGRGHPTGAGLQRTGGAGRPAAQRRRLRAGRAIRPGQSRTDRSRLIGAAPDDRAAVRSPGSTGPRRLTRTPSRSHAASADSIRPPV